MGDAQRMLQTTTCSQPGGFILYKNLKYTNDVPVVCHNCRLLPRGLAATSSSTCACALGFSYLQDWTVCYCYQYRYIDYVSGQCKSCASIGSLMAQCRACSAPFKLNYQGCIYMPTMPNGASGGCVTGYTIGFTDIGCVCNYILGYAVNAAGSCTKCATSDMACLYGLYPYVYDGSVCMHGSLMPNYDYSSKATCKTGTTFKKDPYNGRKIGCACSYAAQYYKNSQGNCVACSASLPSGVALAGCQSCSNTARFYKGSVECIYCPGVAYTVAAGTATVNGCDCLPNYFWNGLTDKCECDFAKGFIGGAISPCIDCSSIANTGITPLSGSCSCKDGYKWNALTNNCDCDTSNGLAFSSNGVCVSCGLISGAIKIGTDGQSCICVFGYLWNPTTKKCVCDFNNNYAVNNKGLCTDCMSHPLSNGLAN
jgi:hypothetical protein